MEIAGLLNAPKGPKKLYHVERALYEAALTVIVSLADLGAEYPATR